MRNSEVTRNTTIDCIKTVAALAVVMKHCNYVYGLESNDYKYIVKALARFAVPFFLMVKDITCHYK